MSNDYSFEAFDAAVEEVESLLGQLYGIEAVSQAVLDYAYQPDVDQGPKTTTALRMPADPSFEIYPDLPVVTDDLGQYGGSFQGWVDQVYESGRAAAGAIGSWLKYIAENYYLVDAGAIISAAQLQQSMTHEAGVQFDRDYGDLNGNLSVHWESDSKEAFFDWFGDAASVVGGLLMYADSAQLVAGAAGDLILATQQLLLRQVRRGRDVLQEAVDAWRNDNDVFPFPPGSGYTFASIGSALSGEIHRYTDEIPLPDLIKDYAIDKAVSKVPYSGIVLKGYDILTKLEARDTDETRPKSAGKLIEAIEEGLSAIIKDGDLAMTILGEKVGGLADEVADPFFLLDRLDRTPGGTYTP